MNLSEKSIAIIDVMRQYAGGIQINVTSKKFSISGGPGYTIKATGWPADNVVHEYALNLIAQARSLNNKGHKYYEYYKNYL
jgi:hypothetical protein